MREAERYAYQQATGAAALTSMSAALRALELYDVRNDLVQRVFDDLARVVREHAERTGHPTLLLQHSEDNWFVDHELLRLELQDIERMSNLGALLRELDYNEIEIHPTATRESLTRFFQAMVRAVAEPEGRALLRDHRHTGASLAYVQGIARKGQSLEHPVRAAVRLVVTLHLFAFQYLHVGRGSASPPTVGMRRVVQSLVDLFDARRDHLIALAHVDPPDGSLAAHVTRSAILAAALAHHSGMPRQLVARAGLAVLVSRLPLSRLGARWHERPRLDVAEEYAVALEEIAGSSGADSPPIWRMVLLHEAMMGVLGRVRPYPGGVPFSFESRAAAIATTYDRIRAGLTGEPGAAPLVPSAAVRRFAAMIAGRDENAPTSLDPELGHRFLGLLDRVPPGSPVLLPDGTYGVVRERPEVVVIADRAGAPLYPPRTVDSPAALPVVPPKGFDPAPALGWTGAERPRGDASG